jgi:hypothetical protein
MSPILWCSLVTRRLLTHDRRFAQELVRYSAVALALLFLASAFCLYGRDSKGRSTGLPASGHREMGTVGSVSALASASASFDGSDVRCWAAWLSGDMALDVISGGAGKVSS